jgi:thioredoxin 1
MPAGCHCANMLAANTHAHLASADLPGSSRWYRICRNRKVGSWTASGCHNEPDVKRLRKMSPTMITRESLPSLSEANLKIRLAESVLPVLVSFQAPSSPVMHAAIGRSAKAFAGHLRVVQVNIAAHPELAARFKIRVVPTLLIFESGVPVEFSVGIVPEHYICETVRKALGGGTETLEAAERHPSNRWLSKSPRRFSLNRRLRCPVS